MSAADTLVERDDTIEQLVAAAPPLSAATRERLRRILTPSASSREGSR